MKVVCIDNSHIQSLRIGSVYTVIDDHKCKCGTVLYLLSEVREPLPPGGNGQWKWMCLKCDAVLPERVGGMFLAKRFVPLDGNLLGVTDREVRELYEPKIIRTKPKEKVNG